MTVLKGPLAVKQSKALMRTFKIIKDYVISSQQLPIERQMLQLSMQVSDTAKYNTLVSQLSANNKLKLK